MIFTLTFTDGSTEDYEGDRWKFTPGGIGGLHYGEALIVLLNWECVASMTCREEEAEPMGESMKAMIEAART